MCMSSNPAKEVIVMTVFLFENGLKVGRYLKNRRFIRRMGIEATL